MINTRSKSQALQVVTILHAHRITRIHTRGALDRLIELVKWPHTRNHKVTKRTTYKNQQYDSIRYWLIRQGFLTQSYDGYRYHYTVVKPQQ